TLSALALSPVPASGGVVRRCACIPVLAGATRADRPDARRMAAVAEHHGDQSRHCDTGGFADLGRWSRAVLVGALAYHAPRRNGGSLAVLCAASVRAHLLEERAGLEFARGGAARQLALRAPKYPALVHREHRRASYPSPAQPYPVLSPTC